MNKTKTSDTISLSQYKSLRDNFKKMTTEILGKGYYNMGADVYTCDKFTCEEITEKFRLHKNNLRIMFVVGVVLGFLMGYAI